MEKAQADLHGDRAHNDYDAGMDQTMRECDESPPPRLLEGIAQFNRGEYFEQHETLELLWRAEPRTVRHLSRHPADWRRVPPSSPWELPRDDLHVDARHALLNTVLAAM